MQLMMHTELLNSMNELTRYGSLSDMVDQIALNYLCMDVSYIVSCFSQLLIPLGGGEGKGSVPCLCEQKVGYPLSREHTSLLASEGSLAMWKFNTEENQLHNTRNFYQQKMLDIKITLLSESKTH